MFALTNQKSHGLVTFGSWGVGADVWIPPSVITAQVSVGGFQISLNDVFTKVGAEVAIVEFTQKLADGSYETVELPHTFPHVTAVGFLDRAVMVSYGVDAVGDAAVQGRLDIFFWEEVTEKKALSIEPTAIPPGLANVLYDPQTGDIRHVHEAVSLPGAPKPDPARSERRAIDIARRSAPDLGDLSALQVPASDLRGKRGLRVDPNSRTLVDSD